MLWCIRGLIMVALCYCTGLCATYCTGVCTRYCTGVCTRYCTGVCTIYCTGVCTKDMTLVVCAPDMAAAPKLSHFRTFVWPLCDNRATKHHPFKIISLLLRRFLSNRSWKVVLYTKSVIKGLQCLVHNLVVGKSF